MFNIRDDLDLSLNGRDKIQLNHQMDWVVTIGAMQC